MTSTTDPDRPCRLEVERCRPHAAHVVPSHGVESANAGHLSILQNGGIDLSLNSPVKTASPLTTRRYGVNPSHASSLGRSDTGSDIAYLESVELTLLDSIQRLSAKLMDSRSSLSGRTRRVPRRTGPETAGVSHSSLSPQVSIAASRQPHPPPNLSRLQLSSLSQAFIPDKSSPSINGNDLGVTMSPRLFSCHATEAAADSQKCEHLLNAAHHHTPYQQPYHSAPILPILPLLPHSDAVAQQLMQSSSSPQQHHVAPQPLRQRIISVSLHLPTKSDRETARQQFFDSRLPPKGMFALEKAADLPFVWVGAPDPNIASSGKDSRLFDEQYGLSLSSQWRSVGLEELSDSFHRQSHIVPVTLPGESALLENFYKFCDKTLWNLLHYDFGSFASDDEMGQADLHWNAYRVVNQRFAEAVSEIYEDGDLIWVHNYHLMLLPSMLRQRLWYAKIGFFLYAPFPSAEIFRILPFRADILKGVLGADLVGFHTFDYSKQFTASCTRLLGLEGTPKGIEVEPRSTRHCEFGIYPAGIDVRELKMRVATNNVKTRVAALRRRFGDCKVIVGIDRLDDAFAGIPLKLLAFERFLVDNRHWHGRVLLVQVASIPKQSMKATFAHRAQINEFVARINSQFGTLAFSPVHYINEELDPADALALMCVGHACMVSVVRDGMGLLPYEWTVCQHSGNKGCLILSEFAGAGASFSTALHINPWNVDEAALKIREALEMKDDERDMRDASAYAFVTTHTASLWGLNFLEDLEQTQGSATGAGTLVTPMLDSGTVLDAYFNLPTSVMSSSGSASILNAGLLTSPETPRPTSLTSPISSPHLSNSLRAASGHSWSEKDLSKDFMSDTNMAWGVSQKISSSIPTPLIKKQRPKKKLFVLDYDGTLVPFQAIAELVAPSAQLVHLVQQLSSLDNCHVVILSGRDRSTLSRWFGHLEVFLVAEDGSFLRTPGDTEWIALFRQQSEDRFGVRHHQGEKTSAPAGANSAGANSAGGVASVSGHHGAKNKCEDKSVFKRAPSAIDDANQPSDDLRVSWDESISCSGYQARQRAQHHRSDVTEPVIDIDGSDIHPLLASSNRHKWSMSSFGSLMGSDMGNIPEWKSQVMPVMAHFAERTPGVILEEGDATLTWHFIDADKEFGLFQARDLQKHLESFLLQHLSVEVISEEGSGRYPTRWVKVRPSGVGKSIAVERTLDWIRDEYCSLREDSRTDSSKSLNSNGGLNGCARTNNFGTDTRSFESRTVNGVDFIFCVGDDRADEGMFDLLGDDEKLAQLGLGSVTARIFTCRVGSGATSASFMIESPQKVIELLEEFLSRSSKSPLSHSAGGFARVAPSAMVVQHRQMDENVGSP